MTYISPVAHRRQSVAAFLYAYTRLLELSCGYTLHVRDTELKVALGRHIGYLGIGLERLSRRIGQMYAAGPQLVAPAQYAAFLDAQAGLHEGPSVASFLVAALADLDRSMERYLADVHVGDEPTMMMLRSLCADLARGMEALRRWAGPAITPVSIDCGGETVSYSATEPVPPVPEFPARPASSVRDPAQANLPKASLQEAMKPAALARFFRRMYIEIEIAAIEVCSRNVIEHRKMPIAFKVDMTQQIWDEARHAEIAYGLVRGFGETLDPLCYSGAVWTRHQLGSDLAERLAIEQCIQEGNSVDKTYGTLTVLRRFDHEAVAEALEWITADETQHALIGNRWLLRLCDNDRGRYEAVMKSANDKINFPLSPVNRELREISGYPSWYVEDLEAQLRK